MSKKVERIYELFLSLEKSHHEKGFDTPGFDQLIEALCAFKDHKDVELFKIYSISQHLKKTMSLRDFMYWIVPIERYLNKSLKDDDFIIFNKDRKTPQMKATTVPMSVVLDNVRSSFNVGSIFRSAEAFNIEKIFLVGYTPDPNNPKTLKTTLGSHEYISWENHSKCLDLVQLLRSQNYWTIAAETTDHALRVETPFPMDKKIAVVFGNERFGLDAQVISACHETRKVPLTGIKNSLNVANCASIFIYEFSKQFFNHQTSI